MCVGLVRFGSGSVSAQAVFRLRQCFGSGCAIDRAASAAKLCKRAAVRAQRALASRMPPRAARGIGLCLKKPKRKEGDRIGLPQTDALSLRA
jgi:hypothetical protein